MKVARHDHGMTDRIVQRNLARHQRTVAALGNAESRTSDQLGAAIRVGVSLAAFQSIVDPEDASVVQGLRVSARSGAGLFAAMGASADVELEYFSGKRYSIAPAPPSEWTNPMTWRQAFYSALAVRDSYSLDLLAAADVDLIRQSVTTANEFAYLHIEALQAYHRRAGDTAERINAALGAADPDVVDPEFKDYVLDIACREIELLFYRIKGEAEPFNEGLKAALESYKHYYTRGRNGEDAICLIALGPLGIACAAADAGIPIEIESEYIPRSVIDYRSAQSA
jgi:hypothetical protein